MGIPENVYLRDHFIHIHLELVKACARCHQLLHGHPLQLRLHHTVLRKVQPGGSMAKIHAN